MVSRKSLDFFAMNVPRFSLLDTASRLLRIDLLRFLLIGVLNTVFGYVIFLAGLGLSLGPGMALAASTTIGALFNYISTGRIVFRNEGFGKLPAFVAAYGLFYVINLGALHGLASLGLPASWAQGVLLPVLAVASFVVFKYFVFGNVRLGGTRAGASGGSRHRDPR